MRVARPSGRGQTRAWRDEEEEEREKPRRTEHLENFPAGPVIDKKNPNRAEGEEKRITIEGVEHRSGQTPFRESTRKGERGGQPKGKKKNRHHEIGERQTVCRSMFEPCGNPREVRCDIDRDHDENRQTAKIVQRRPAFLGHAASYFCGSLREETVSPPFSGKREKR